jgi:hypothetical protein
MQPLDLEVPHSVAVAAGLGAFLDVSAAQKALSPVPVRTTAATSGDAHALLNAWISSSTVRPRNAFSCDPAG